MSNKESSIEKLKRKLHVRGKKPELRKRRALHDFEPSEVSKTWNEAEEVEVEAEEEREPTPEEKKEALQQLYEGQVEGNDDFEALKRARTNKRTQKEKKKNRLISRIIKGVFIASFMFFLLAASFAGYYIIFGKNQVSCENVSIDISGPGSTASGKKMSLDVEVENNNPVPMHNATLEVFFPKGTRDTDYSTINLSSSYEQIGTIETKERVRSTVQAVLFGPEQTQHTIEAVLKYEIDDSNASFSCKQPYNINIATAPVSLSVDGLEEISSGQEIELEVTVTSNAEEMVPMQRLIVEYPFGFEFISASPEPTTNDNIWNIGDILPGKEKKLTIRGIIKGQGTESRSINFSVGEEDITNKEEISTILQKIEHPILVTEPFLDVALEFHGSKGGHDVVSQLGDSLHGKLIWKNNLEDALHDLEIDVTYSGSALDPATMSTQSGFFRSVDNTITWTPITTNGDFRTIEAGESGSNSFTFETKEFEEGVGIENPTIQLEATVRARRVSDTREIPQNLHGQAKTNILFDTDLEVDAYALYGVGPFSNTGPHPPRVNKETTYTIVWEVTNTINNTDDVQVRSVLPEHVEWLDVKNPNNAQVTYNPVTRQVIWSVGDVPRGVGYETQASKMSFQVSVVPSISQRGRSIDLTQAVAISGVDVFTKSVLEKSMRAISTELKRDPFFNDTYGEVKL